MSNISVRKKLGQIFLQDKTVLEKILSAAEIKAGDFILEIGPGKGILTASLLKQGGNILAIEKDPQLVKFIRNRFGNRPNLEIVQADIRDFLREKKQIQYINKDRKYKVVGNIPYYLTSYLIRLLLESSPLPSLIILMVQKEVAQRIVAQPPKMNLLAVTTQFYAKPEIISFVSRLAFSPSPKVDSAIIKLIPLLPQENKIDKKLFFKVVKAGFQHPRKLLLNNLPYNLKISKDQLQKILVQMHLPFDTRAQNLSVAQWKTLTHKIASLFPENIV